MTALFVVRHPQTTWNAEERYQGRLEAPLSPAGQEQAEAIAGAFAGRRIDAIVSSPLQRALGLAEAIARRTSAPIEIDQRLTEIAMGPWEGLYRVEIEKRFPDLYHAWYVAPQDVRFPRGETLAEVAARVRGALGHLFARCPDSNVVLTSHSVVVQMIVMLTLGLEFSHIHRLRVSNGGITTICGTEAPGRLLSLNVTDHLYGSAVAAAALQDCVSWKERRMTV